MDIIDALLNLFSVADLNNDSKKNKSELFLTISVLVSFVLILFSLNIFKTQNIIIVLVSITSFSIFLNIGVIYFLVKLNICKPASFWNFIAYLISLIILTISLSLFGLNHLIKEHNSSLKEINIFE